MRKIKIAAGMHINNVPREKSSHSALNHVRMIKTVPHTENAYKEI